MSGMAHSFRAGADASPEQGFDVIDTRLVVRRLLRRKWLVLSGTVALFAAFAALTLSIPSWYTAEARIVVDQRPQGADLAAVLSRLPTDSQAVLTEAEALRSRTLVEKTIAQLGLLSDPEFNPTILPTDNSLRSRARRLQAQLSSLVGSYIRKFTGPGREAPGNAAENEAVKLFLKQLYVAPVGRSQVLTVAFTSKSPELAARALNTLISLYLAAQIEHRLSVPQTLVEFMRGELDRLQARVRAADEALERYRSEANLEQGITQGREALLSTQELSQDNAELTTIKTKRQQAESRLNEIRANPDSFPDVLGSVTIQQLRHQLSAQRENRSQLLAVYGPSHPKVQQVEASIADTEQRARVEVNKIVDSLASEVTVLTNEERALTATIGQLKQQIGSSGESRVRLARLQQDAEVSRSILTSFLTQYNQLASQRALQVADSYVLSAATVPTETSFPPTIPFLGVGALGAFILSCGGTLLLERRGETIRSAREIQPLLMVRPLGVVPRLPAAASAFTEVLEHAQSPYTEAIRGILSNLPSGPERSRVILVSSALAGDGKTSVAVALSRLAALSGKRVMLVECDLRRPALHRAFQSAAAPGLADVLQGTAGLRDACRRDPLTGLDFIPSGNIGPHAANLLNVPAMKKLIKEMKQSHDLVLLDSPPSAAVSDARVLAQLADEVMFVVSWRKTPWRLVREEIERIAYGEDNLAGVVLNKVDLRRHSREYGYPAVEATRGLGVAASLT
jgi:capsular exopolysaccharide synthesis family protein